MSDVNTYRAWINVKTKVIQRFSAQLSHYDYVKEHPVKFGLDSIFSIVIKNGEIIDNADNTIDDKSFLEDEGWVAASIKKIDGKIEVSISALTVKNILTATRILYQKRHKYGSWDLLKINTMLGNFVFKGQEKITEYILGR